LIDGHTALSFCAVWAPPQVAALTAALAPPPPPSCSEVLERAAGIASSSPHRGAGGGGGSNGVTGDSHALALSASSTTLSTLQPRPPPSSAMLKDEQMAADIAIEQRTAELKASIQVMELRNRLQELIFILFSLTALIHLDLIGACVSHIRTRFPRPWPTSRDTFSYSAQMIRSTGAPLPSPCPAPTLNCFVTFSFPLCCCFHSCLPVPFL
jgi:hypothetical protein